MTVLAMAVGGIVIAYLAALMVTWLTDEITFQQAFWLTPFKLFWRLDEVDGTQALRQDGPVIYVICHQSSLDPAIMLARLPSDTLHILDTASANAAWMEPYRALARTIAFRAKQVFVSRRLVRHLKGNGRLAVYIPSSIEPDRDTMRLYRAVGRIGLRGDAKIVPIVIEGAQYLPFANDAKSGVPRRFFSSLTINTLPALTMAELMARSPRGVAMARHALFDRMADARAVAFLTTTRTLYSSMVAAARRYGTNANAVSDPLSGSLTRKRMLIGSRILARRFSPITRPGEPLGIMLPNANAVTVAFFGCQSAGRPAAMINYTSGPANVASAIKTAAIKKIVSSRTFIEKADLSRIVEAAENAGAEFVWLEDMQAHIGLHEKIMGALSWRQPVYDRTGDDPAVILFTSGSEGLPKGVVLSHRNILANVSQIAARVDFSPADRLFNVLPVFHSFGLTGGTILPLLSGVDLFLYPSPLHYKLIPQSAARVKPTIMFGTDTFLTGYARSAKDEDFSSLRMVVAGAEPVKPETERTWRERFNVSVLEGFGMTEASPVVAVNSQAHGRLSTVGRLLPGIEARLEPVDGITDGGRLWIKGPNVMLGYLTEDRPGQLQPLETGWHDSGDIVDIDREGFVAIKGRVKRFAKIAGEMVSLGAVEMLVGALWPEERHAAVAVPDKRKGERIVLVTTATEAEAETLRAFGREAGAAELMVPHDIIKVGEIPLLGSGKTDYPAARKIALERLGLADG